MNEGKNTVPKGIYDCVLVGATRSKKVNHAQHYILSLRLRPTDCGVENPCEYFAELPILYKTGVEFNFYDKEKNVSVRRKCTSADTNAAVENALKCVAAWGDYFDANEGASFAECLKWFDAIPSGVMVKASVKEPREYNGRYYYEATLVEPFAKKEAVGSVDDFNAEFGAVIKAAGLRHTGVAAKKPKKPSVPPAPPAPTATYKVYTSEDAWAAYEGGERIKNDPNGAAYWGEVEKIVGKPMKDYANFTSEDWAKCVDVFSIPF